MMHVACPNCGTVNERDESSLEAELRCVACQSVIAAEGQTKTSSSRRTFFRSRHLTWLLMLVACLIVVVMISFAFFGWGGDEPTAIQPQIKTQGQKAPTKTGHSAIQ
jgi:hypothetical protein